MDDHADGRPDGESHGVRDGVVDVDHLHLEAAEAEAVAGLFRENLRVIEEVELLELELDYARGEAGGVDGHVQLAHDIGQSADVVLVAVCDDYAADAVLVLPQIGDVGYDGVNAVELLVRKAQTAVHDNNVLPVFVHGEVLADLTEAAERDYFQFCHIILLKSKIVLCTTVIQHYNR